MRQKSGTLRFVKKEPIYYHLLVLSIKFVIFLGLIPIGLIKTMLNFSHTFVCKVKIIFNLSFLTFNFFRRKRGRPRKIQKFINELIPKPVKIVLSLLIFLTIFFTYSYSLVKLAHSLPTPDRLSNLNGPLTTEFYDRNGQLLYRLYEGQNRKLVKLEDLPKTLIDATVAIEDKNFFSHPGIDLFGILRALRANFNNGNRSLQGGSTITQQLIKNTLLSPDKTFSRKIREVILAFWTEQVYSKNEILQMYFNEVAFGGTAWGIEAAAEMYFGKKPKDLSLAEAAFLAGLPAAPTEYSPYGVNPNQGKLRQIEVLRRMVEEGLITQDEAKSATSEELSFKPPLIDIKAPHFVFYAKSILASKYGDRYLSSGGLKIITTLDLSLQEMVEDIVRNKVDELSNLNVTNGAALVTETKTGHILAMVGSKDYFSATGGNYNVTTALRQPGSAIKVVTYTAAFKQGFQPFTLLLDSPTAFGTQTGQVYTPVNYDARFHGPIPLRVALASSYNVPAVKTLSLIGIPAFLETARDLGITTFNQPENYGLSLTLGGADIKMVDMMAVYGTLANLGVRSKPNPILKVIDPSGKVLEDNQYPQGKKVVTHEIAYLITDILSDNKARTPGFGAKSLLEIPGYNVAVKTGTSDSKRDNWTFGYTPEYVVGAWVGNNDNTPMNPALTSGVTGATPIWHEIMAKLLAGKPNLSFEKPAGIVETMVNGQKDITIAGNLPKTVVGIKKEVKKDGNGVDKEIITFTDPFNSYTLDKIP